VDGGHAGRGRGRDGRAGGGGGGGGGGEGRVPGREEDARGGDEVDRDPARRGELDQLPGRVHVGGAQHVVVVPEGAHRAQVQDHVDLAGQPAELVHPEPQQRQRQVA